jgi:hypothetical protein
MIVTTGLAGRPAYAHRNLFPQGLVPPVTYTYAGDVQNGSALFGLSLLRSAYAGQCLKVRRSSDNAEQDVGFASTFVLDTASMLSFCGAGNGFIKTWYDQSGNGRNYSQATAGSQPQIVTSGALTATIGGNPALTFSGGTHLVGGTATGYCGNTEFTVFTVLDVTSITGSSGTTSFYNNDDVWGDTGGWIAGTVRKSSNNFQAGCNNDAAEQTISTATSYVAVAQHTGGKCYTYINSQTSGANKTVTNSSMSSSVMRIGSGFGASFNGHIAACVFYSASVSAGNLNSIGAALASYYGVSWS